MTLFILACFTFVEKSHAYMAIEFCRYIRADTTRERTRYMVEECKSIATKTKMITTKVNKCTDKMLLMIWSVAVSFNRPIQ